MSPRGSGISIARPCLGLEDGAEASASGIWYQSEATFRKALRGVVRGQLGFMARSSPWQEERDPESEGALT